MSDNTAQGALWTLLVDDLIDRRMGSEVEKAKEIMERFLDSRPARMDRKQLSNLEAVAAETGRVQVVEDWVRYQMGRDASRQNWRAGTPPFGEAVLGHLKELKNVARELVANAKGKGLQPPDEAEEVAQVWIRLTRRFAALLEHTFTYRRGPEKGGRE